MSTVRRAYIYPTLNCNLTCEHCYTLRPAFKQDFDYKRVAYADIFEVVSKLLSLGVEYFDISGGEPLLFPKIVELCQKIRQAKKTNITLVSNGTLFRKRAETIASLAPLVDHWVLSIESGSATVHDRIRGAKSFERAIDGLRVLREQNIDPVSINTVFFPENEIDEIPGVLNIASEFGVRDVHFMQLKWDHSWQPGYLEILDRCLEKLSRCQPEGVRVRIDVPPLFLRELKKRWQTPLGRNVRIQSLELRGSQSFNGEIVVAANGDVTGNVDMLYRDEFVAGNLELHPVEEVFANMRQFRDQIRDRKRRLKDGHCSGCGYWLECGGGSPEMAVSLATWQDLPDRRCPRLELS